MADPWVGAAEKYPAGGKVKGKVVGVVDYGVFVELEQGIEGLVHVSEMSWNKKVTHPSKLVKVGDEVDVVVLDIKQAMPRFAGLKQAQPDPWLLTAEKYPVGTVVTGKVSQHRGIWCVHRNRGWLRRACACGRRELDRAREKPAQRFSRRARISPPRC